MINLSDTIVGVVMIAVIGGYVFVNQVQGAPNEAVLGEISQIMNDLESELKQVEGYDGSIPQDAPLKNLLEEGKNTILMGKPSDPPLMPDIHETDKQQWLGGCLTDDKHWSLLRSDYSALTQIPERWHAPTIKVCLDRNGSKGPNLEGFDVIWLSFSRTGSPHITLIPVATDSVGLKSLSVP